MQPIPHFKAGDILKTPLNRRVLLLLYDKHEGRWRCRYVDGDLSLVSLPPHLLRYA